LYCQSKNLSPKTLSSYEQSLKLFIAYFKHERGIEEAGAFRIDYIIGQYVAYLQERGM
jgi:integrase/recombinase XerD